MKNDENVNMYTVRDLNSITLYSIIIHAYACFNCFNPYHTYDDT